MQLSQQVIDDLTVFIALNIDDFKADAIEYDGLDITFGTNENGTEWSYQTGDNSFTGGCYCHPHWAVEYIGKDTDRVELRDSIVDQLNELLPE